MTNRFALIACSLCLPLVAGVPKQAVRVVTTDRVEAPAGATVRVTGSVGELNIEGWDRPEVEVTVTRSSYPDRDKAAGQLDAIQVVTKRGDGSNVDISTTLPAHGKKSYQVDYRIRVPRDAKLMIHHQNGDVVVYNVGGDIEASAHVGAITLQVPSLGAYAIDAKCKIGDVYSDFAGSSRNQHWFGQTFHSSETQAPHKLVLRVDKGNIKIQQMAPVVAVAR